MFQVTGNQFQVDRALHQEVQLVQTENLIYKQECSWQKS